jgi:hypothetical protein
LHTRNDLLESWRTGASQPRLWRLKLRRLNAAGNGIVVHLLTVLRFADWVSLVGFRGRRRQWPPFVR